MVRFTPLLDTNDTFEVRSTFEKLAGPKFLALLSEQMDNVLSDQSMHDLTAQMLKENGLDFLPPGLALKIANQHHGGALKTYMRTFMQRAIDEALVPKLNDPKNANDLLKRLGNNLLCFSLSERADSSPMWAHYADNNKGFVVAFNTENDWFKKRKSGAKMRLQKVTYFDGTIEEPLANPMVAFISKTTDWSYEREWRLYCRRDDTELTVIDANEQLYLRKFPPEVVDRVILGPKAGDELAARIKAIIATSYPHHVRLTKAVPNRKSHSYDEIPV